MQNTFGKSIIPENDSLRIEEVNSYTVIIDEFPGKYFTAIATTIAKSFNTPIALISLVRSEHVEFKGNYGMEEVDKVDRGISLCSLAILDSNPTIFKDAREEPCLLNNPLVVGNFGLRFYAGATLTTKEGFNIGTVCVVGKEPRNFSSQETALLCRFANSIMIELEDRKILKAK